MIGYVIPSKGDIVVGQEFTDFDKGLEEGIEGSVLGFNFLLSSAFHSQEMTTSIIKNSPSLNIFPTSQKLININSPQELITTNNAQTLINTNAQELINSQGFNNLRLLLFNGRDDFNNNNIKRKSFQKRSTIYQQNPFVFYKTNEQGIFFEEKKNHFENAKTMFQVPLGLQLITISHSHCEIGRGSPFIGGHLMLISWTRTPVRVFGGAIVKSVNSACGYFY